MEYSGVRRRYDPEYSRYYETVRVAKRPRSADRGKNDYKFKKLWTQCCVSFFIFLTFLILSNLNFKASENILSAVEYTLSYSVDFGESIKKVYSAFSAIKEKGTFNFFYNRASDAQSTESVSGSII